MFIYISSAGYITKQPLFINLIGMFAPIITSTNISFFLFQYSTLPTLSYFIPPFIEKVDFVPVDPLIFGSKNSPCYLLIKKINVPPYAAFRRTAKNQLCLQNIWDNITIIPLIIPIPFCITKHIYEFNGYVRFT